MIIPECPLVCVVLRDNPGFAPGVIRALREQSAYAPDLVTTLLEMQQHRPLFFQPPKPMFAGDLIRHGLFSSEALKPLLTHTNVVCRSTIAVVLWNKREKIDVCRLPLLLDALEAELGLPPSLFATSSSSDSSSSSSSSSSTDDMISRHEFTKATLRRLVFDLVSRSSDSAPLRAIVIDSQCIPRLLKTLNFATKQGCEHSQGVVDTMLCALKWPSGNNTKLLHPWCRQLLQDGFLAPLEEMVATTTPLPIHWCDSVKKQLGVALFLREHIYDRKTADTTSLLQRRRLVRINPASMPVYGVGEPGWFEKRMQQLTTLFAWELQEFEYRH